MQHMHFRGAIFEISSGEASVYSPYASLPVQTVDWVTVGIWFLAAIFTTLYRHLIQLHAGALHTKSGVMGWSATPNVRVSD